jgi:hypothetical protein
MHYQNGREAHVGDPVVGRTYNRLGVVSGTLISLTPGLDACSAKVGFLRLVTPVPEGYQVHSGGVVAIQGTQNHGASGEKAATVYEEDYTECKKLMHAEDVFDEWLKGSVARFGEGMPAPKDPQQPA